MNKVFARTNKTVGAESVCFFKEVEMCREFEPAPVKKIEISVSQPSWREQAALNRDRKETAGAKALADMKERKKERK